MGMKIFSVILVIAAMVVIVIALSQCKTITQQREESNLWRAL